ncbi:formyltetrahydrofolate deformylase 2, mitochondrial-like isoform X2 [Durio zibethinus]|uniref:Formyltetrahydrofolate deformylase 2, mitochondrial-like isoform X2 n=1 Tax=Durio zibethinus TaxID=66656 RepID=A0A6P5YCA2_DURZI|nr:formyltetrahydrofolate deformylase 2, mitochondrial-like isoform X2 [Durio zibethinus]
MARRVPLSISQFVGFAKRSFNSYKLPGDPSSSSPLTHGIHVFQCPDEVGIVAKLSECIASRGGNILGADVFVPEKKNVFYSRSEFVFDTVKWPREQMDEDFLKLSKMFSATRSVVRVPELDPKFKIAVLASKQDHCLVDLLYGWQEGRLPVDITCVISNHHRGPNTHVMRFLERNNIPYHYLHTTKENKREEDILELVLNTDFLVLARYMQILSGHFLRTYGKDVINIHHGLLPSFKGGNPSKQVERVSHRDNLQSFAQKSENLERQCLAKAMRSYCELRVLPYEENRTVVF